MLIVVQCYWHLFKLEEISVIESRNLYIVVIPFQNLHTLNIFRWRSVPSIFCFGVMITEVAVVVIMLDEAISCCSSWRIHNAHLQIWNGHLSEKKKNVAFWYLKCFFYIFLKLSANQFYYFCLITFLLFSNLALLV